MNSTNFHSVFFMVLSTFCVICRPLLADQIFGSFSYAANPEGITITDFTNSAASRVEIPQNIAGEPVTRIGKNAFYNRQRLIKVVIPKTITRIEDYAFFNCIGLMDVSLPVGLTDVGRNAFANCESLLEITLPSSMTGLESGSFSGCRRLRNLSISPGISTIAPFAFSRCIALNEILIPKGVSRIESYAFEGCKELKLVEIPGSVKVIGTNAFVKCSKLKNLRLSEGLAHISELAFAYCINLDRVIIPASMERIDANAFSKSLNLTKITFLGKAPIINKYLLFGDTSSDLTVYFLEGMSGFTTPDWQGYPSAITRLAPEIQVRQFAKLPLEDGKATIDFGQAAAHRVAGEKIFKLENIGTADLDHLEITIDGPSANDFRITAPAKNSLSVNGTMNFKVTFKPSGTGPRNAKIHINGEDVSGGSFDIKLSGRGLK